MEERQERVLAASAFFKRAVCRVLVMAQLQICQPWRAFPRTLASWRLPPSSDFGETGGVEFVANRKRC
jgi:hypothetical protein